VAAGEGGSDYLGRLEDLEVLGHCGPADGEEFGQLAGGGRALGQAGHDSAAGRVGQRGQDGADLDRHSAPPIA